MALSVFCLTHDIFSSSTGLLSVITMIWQYPINHLTAAPHLFFLVGMSPNFPGLKHTYEATNLPPSPLKCVRVYYT